MKLNTFARGILTLSFGILVSGCGAHSYGGVSFVPTASESLEQSAHTYTVTSTKDTGSGSLRAVILAAKNHSKIVFKLRKGATIVLKGGPIDVSKSVTITGPGASALKISGNGKTRIFTIDAHASVSIADLTLTKGKATQGGAILNSGTLKLDDVSLTHDAATGATPAARPQVTWPHFDPRPRARRARLPKAPLAPRIPAPLDSTSGLGGAIYNAAKLTISSATFSSDGAGAGSGGAIYNAAGSNLTVSASSFSANQAAQGGAIFNAGVATLSGDTFKGNTGWISEEYGYGGALYIQGNTSVTKSSFANGIVGGAGAASYGAGGAIAQFSGVATVSDSTFTSNLAGGGNNGSWGTGGAVYVSAGSLTLTSNTFTSNRAGGDASGRGGAVYADPGFHGSQNIFSANSAFGTASEAGAYGGAIYSGGTLALSGDSFSSNVAAGGGTANAGVALGGAIDAEDGATLTSVSFVSNSASGGTGGSGEGGAVYVGGGSSTWTSLTFSSNVASALGANSFASGGAIAAFAPVTIGGTTSLASNAATAAKSGEIGGLGGAVAVEVGPFSFSGSASGNSATTQGGAFWIDDVASIANSAIAGNKILAVQQPQDGGGGIYVSLGGGLTLTASTLSSNSTSGAVAFTGGGGLFNSASATLVNSTIAGNTSSMDGGGIENDSVGTTLLTNVTVYANTASGVGGSLKNLDSDSTITVANSIFAGGHGGGSPDDVSNDGTVTSNDYNLVQQTPTGNALAGTTTHNIVGSSPGLSALANNGGPTQTAADGSGSPGIAYIPYSVCVAAGVTVDQRQYKRNPTGTGFCDIGAYENQNPP